MEPTTAVEIQEEIQLRIHELNHTDDDHVAGDAARILFELAHFSNPYSESNKRQIAASGGVGALCKHLRSQSYEVRYQTCSALGELAFRNEENCVLVVNTSDALPALAEMLACSTGNNQEDAALVINNCASFCEETAEQIVRCPGMLASLKLLAVGRHVGAKNVSIGALNCLSRSPAVLAQLVEAKVVDEALVPVLEERGRGEKLEVRKARAMMAVVNLTGALPPLPLAAAPRAPLQQRQHHGDHHQQQHLAQLPAHHRQQQQAAAGGRGADLAAIVRVLGFALDGKKWECRSRPTRCCTLSAGWRWGGRTGQGWLRAGLWSSWCGWWRSGRRRGARRSRRFCSLSRSWSSWQKIAHSPQGQVRSRSSQAEEVDTGR